MADADANPASKLPETAATPAPVIDPTKAVTDAQAIVAAAYEAYAQACAQLDAVLAAVAAE